MCSCKTKVITTINKSYTPIDYRDKIIVFELNEALPENVEILGKIKIGDSGFTTNCSYETVMEQAKTEARKVGANGIKITEHKTPSAMSTCHRIKADIIKLGDYHDFLAVKEEQMKEENKLLDVDYSILHVYRPRGVGPLVSYDLYLGDSVICRIKNRMKKTLKIRKEGYISLWAKTEAKEEIPINLIKGKEYYLRCSVRMGIMVGRPSLELVDKKTGKAEFDAVQLKEADKKDVISLIDGRDIECKITSEDDEKVYFTIISKGKKTNSYCPKNKIKSIQKAG